MTRYITDAATVGPETTSDPDPTPVQDRMEGRYRLYRLCPCENCGGEGKTRDESNPLNSTGRRSLQRCKNCRGEGKTLDLVATATDPESVGVALVTLCLEGEFEECPFGLMDRPEGQTGRWLLKPWTPSPRNVSDAGRVLQTARRR